VSSDREFQVYPDMVGRLQWRGSAMIADNAVVLGDVHFGEDVSIWFGVTVRGDDSSITIGDRTNIQDNTAVHVDLDAPLVIGEGVTIGHGAIVHGVELGDYCLVGMGCTILGGARIGSYSILAAGTVIPENAVIPDGSVVMGLPGKVRRQVTEVEREAARWRAEHYVERARSYLDPAVQRTRNERRT
jgi:carbonic anhydrase/acetyltransferase-like protein (isoleucine patch superfamily)